MNMSKWWSLKIVSFVLLASLPTLAQSSSDLERKYGKRSNHLVQRVGFEVRPGIIMTASFALDEQVCEVVIEPKRVTESGIDVDRGMPAVVARQIVDEIVPVALRGPHTRGITMGNYTSVNLANYEKVSIRSVLVGVGWPEADLKITEVRIKWKERHCQ
jgi:hypothetical protein